MSCVRWICLALSVAPLLRGQAVQFRTRELPGAAVGSGYNASVEVVVNGRCPSGTGAAFAVAQGSLPRGLELRGDTLTGVPSEVGTFPILLRAITACGEAEREFTVTVSGRPILRAVPEELVFEYRLGGADPGPQSVRVSSTWAGLPYSVRAANGPWLVNEPRRGATPERGAALAGDEITVRINPEKLAAGVYHATLVISAWQGANAPEIPVTLKVVQ